MSYHITQPNVNATKSRNSLEIIDLQYLARIFELRLRLKSARLEKLVLLSGKLFQTRATR